MINKTIVLGLLFTLSTTLHAQIGVETDPKTGKKGLIHPIEGYNIIPFLYDEVHPWGDDTLATVSKGTLKGLFTQNGRAVLPVQFEDVDVSWHSGIAKSGYAAAKKGGKWALYDLKGKAVLPHQYEYVRPVLPGLLAARLPGDSALQFFRPRGEQVFQAPGKQAKPGFNDQTIEITRADRSYYFCDRSGAPVFPEWAVSPQWTDGKTIFCGKRLNNVIFEEAGLLSWSGDTILPCIYLDIDPIPSDQSAIRNPNSAIQTDRFLITQRDKQMGLCDAQGQWLIPMAPGELKVNNLVDRGIFIRQGKGRFDSEVYDHNGRSLLRNCRIQGVDWSIFWLGVNAEQHRMKYVTAATDEGETMGLYHADGRLLLPMQFARIIYCSDLHPFLTQANGLWNAYTPDGTALFSRPYKELRFTSDPKVFQALPADGAGWGFVTIGEEEKAVFESDRMHQISPAYYFSVRVQEKYYLHDPSGKRLNPEGFVFVGTPGMEEYQAWRAAKKPGKLVATGTRSQTFDGPWVGFNEQGKAFPMPAVKRRDMSAPDMDVQEEMPSGKGQ